MSLSYQHVRPLQGLAPLGAQRLGDDEAGPSTTTVLLLLGLFAAAAYAVGVERGLRRGA